MQSRLSIDTPSLRLIKEEEQDGHKDYQRHGSESVPLQESEQSIRQSDFEEGLRQKLVRLKLFIDSLGDFRNLPLNSQLLEQLQIEQQVYRNVGSETVILQTEKRIEKMTKTRKLKRNWSVCDLKILIWLICKHCEQSGLTIAEIHNVHESWKLISSLIPGTTTDSCLFKWLSLKRHKITLHGWSEQQEKILIDLEKKHTESRNKWKYISEQLYILNPNAEKIYRHPKQCREHYASFLDPQIKKGPWTKEEDLTLLSHIIENNGEKKWCRLVKILEGRTENAIKNRFQLIFAKLRKKKQNKSKGQAQLIAEYVKENGGELPPIKKQRDTAVNNESPPQSNQSLNVKMEENRAEEIIVKFPIIPTFTNITSSRSVGFTPYLQQTHIRQLDDQELFKNARRYDDDRQNNGSPSEDEETP